MIHLGLNKELVGESRGSLFSAPEIDLVRPREIVIYDKTSHQLEEVRKDIAMIVPIEIGSIAIVKSSLDGFKKEESKNRWQNVFNLRKMKMLS